MDKIKGTPEGRTGVWLVSPEEAVRLVDAVPGAKVHNYIGGEAGVIVGADWDKDMALDCVREAGARCALVFPPNLTCGHQLVVITDRRDAFDVGEIDESRMVPAGVG